MTVLYLKYRPKQFADLDSVEARNSLIRLFSAETAPHALLLTGSKGIGKTSAARLIAKSLNCEENQKNGKKSVEPCNRCRSCLSVDNGSNLDIFETDAASNRGIDDIRELREKIKLAPAQSRYKVYIIDEVHMLTTESFNALLKTLEEPPKHAFFVLCTTDFEKLPKTIVSRCTRVHFKKATKQEILTRLKKVVEGEGLEAEDDGLAAIARYSDGSFRDAIKLLEQTNSVGRINLSEVGKAVGLNSDYPVEQLLEYLEKRQGREALEWIGGADEANINFKLMIQELVERLRRLMLKTFGVQVEPVNHEYVFSLKQIQSLVRLLQQAYWEMKQNPIASLPLEMAVIDYLSGAETDEAGSNFSQDRTAANEVKAARKGVVNPSAVSETGMEVAPLVAAVIEETRTDNENKAETKQIESDSYLDSRWQQILEEVKPLNHSVLAFLRASRPLSIDERGNLTIEVFYKFHKDQLETDRCRKIFERAAGIVLACDVKLRCTLGKGKPVIAPPKEPVYGVRLDNSSLPKKGTDDIIDLAEQIFNGGTVQ